MVIAYTPFSLKQDTIYPVAIALGAVFGLSAIGYSAVHFGFVHWWYASPFVALVAVITTWQGGVAGYTAAVSSAVINNIVFVQPMWTPDPPTPAEVVVYLSMFCEVWLIHSQTSALRLLTRHLAATTQAKPGSVIIFELGRTRQIRDI